MGFTTEEWVRIIVTLQGMQKLSAGMAEGSVAMKGYAGATNQAALASKNFTKRSFLQNQVLFTGRRLLFYSTLGMIAFGAAAAGLGLQYYNAMQTTRVALGQVITDQAKLNKVMNDLFIMAATTPFQIKDIAVQFKALYIPMSKFGYSTEYVNDLLLGMMNALSVVGRLTGQQLQRATVQIIHLVAMGRPMGQVINALMRDNIPVYQALEKYYHLTAEQMRNIASSGLTARQVLDAISKYMRTEPGYAMQAFLSQTKTLQGAWSTFKDFLSQAAAGGEGGFLSGVQKILQGVDKQLLILSQHGKTITFMDVAKAFDRQLSPKTHIVINLFIFLREMIRTVIRAFGLFAIAIRYATIALSPLFWVMRQLRKYMAPIDWLLRRFGFMTGSTGNLSDSFDLLGKATGILIVLWTIGKIKVIAFSLAEEAAAVITWGLTKATKALTWAQTLYTDLLNSKAILAMKAWYSVLMTGSVKGEGGKFRKLTDFEKMLKRLRAQVILLTAAVWSDNAAWYANPITWVAVAVILLTVGLVLLITKVRSLNKWLRENYRWFVLLLIVFGGPFGAYVAGVITLTLYWRKIAGWIKAAYEWMKKLVSLKWMPGGGKGGFLNKLFNIAKYTPLNPVLAPTVIYEGVKRRASGGYTSGWTMVGERGPELLRLPTNSRIFGNSSVPVPLAAGGGLVVKVYPQAIYFDRQKVGEVVARVVTDREARL